VKPAAVLNLTMTNIRSVMGSMVLTNCSPTVSRDQCQAATRRRLGSEPWGVKITRNETADIDPPKNLIESMVRQMMAKREKRAASSRRKASVRPRS
jgi:regulator of protease activity HflC (stomatin/prohibitin superfamily)